MSSITIKQTITQYHAFMDYRYQAYKNELAQLLVQLKNFGLLFFVVLGSAMLGMILLLFLGLGKIIDSADAPQHGAQMAWLYLLLQSVMLSAMKSAIKNSQQRLFQRTIVKSGWLKLMDIKLLLLSNGWLVASAVIAFDLTLTQWLKAPHFILFMSLQFGLGILCLYNSRALTIGFLLSAILVCVPVEIQPLIYHLGFVLLFTLSLFIPQVALGARLSVSSLLSFWVMFFVNHTWVLVWRCALLLCVFMASSTLLHERPDLAEIFTILALAFIVLFTSSLQFDCGKLHEKYQLFFKANNQARRFFISQFVPSMIFFSIALAGFMALFKQENYVLLIMSLIWCGLQLFAAKKKPAHYALVWICVTALLLAF
ncbi:hypothetical protein AMS58_13765 [Pseudoalteromonas porphyrae]|uniref:DUF6136 family protein n=1 Tax=Pseudoalteromonas TaxID=53246 RepID=UPI0006BAC051|nr:MULTISPECIES: DUF6136 family protein [Pseudoalteromonas]KPH94021.1 hypothetical protein AMS58_13765 [Pseudoalteromonas porphyrae]NNG42830.1 hypothetical protein [Pseudoalteromonas sp. NEC-BIFX-2020_002]